MVDKLYYKDMLKRTYDYGELGRLTGSDLMSGNLYTNLYINKRIDKKYKDIVNTLRIRLNKIEKDYARYNSRLQDLNNALGGV